MKKKNLFKDPVFVGWRETIDGKYRVERGRIGYHVYESIGTNFIHVGAYSAESYDEALEAHKTHK